MNPLTVTWAPHLYTDWGWQNFQAWMHAGYDNLLMTPNGRVHRLLTRLATEKLLHPFQPFMMGQFYFPVRMAARFNIKLVFFGESEDGQPKSETVLPGRSINYYSTRDQKNIFLGGVAYKDLIEHFGLRDVDLHPYTPIHPDELQDSGCEFHWLGYYVKWHPLGNYYYCYENMGFKPAPERNAGSYNKYIGIDDKIDDFNYYTTHIKFGMGRATYDAVHEVRAGDITREEALTLVRKYDGEFPERFFEDFLRYISLPPEEFPVASKMFERPIMDREYFHTLCDNARSPHLWMWNKGEWRLRHPVS
jgi:N-acetyl sugar amidotransferase